MIKLRPATEADRPMIEQWLAKDEFHQSVGVKIEDAYAKGTELIIAEDDEGPIWAIRLNLAVHMAVQFNPDTRHRNSIAGEEIIRQLSDAARKLEATELFARPGGRAIAFADRLGFSDFVGKVKCV